MGELASMQRDRESLTVAELRLQLDQLHQADWIRLERSANALCWGLAIQGQDLLNEMFRRAVEGKRKCPVDVPASVFIIRGMGSLVSAYLKWRSRDALEQALASKADDCDDATDFLDQDRSMDPPEEILIAAQTREKYEKLFDDNETAQMVLMGRIDGHTPQEIQEICDLTPTAYASALQFIRRKLDKLADEESVK